LYEYSFDNDCYLPKEIPFSTTGNAELLISTILRYKRQGRFFLHAFAVVPEHLHVVITPSNGQTLERCVQCIKGGFSSAVRKQFRGEVWQAGFYEHRIRDAEDFRGQVEYVARNPEPRYLKAYPFVHTQSLTFLDPRPEHLGG
jgi:REP-associated tyrosine transposase